MTKKISKEKILTEIVCYVATFVSSSSPFHLQHHPNYTTPTNHTAISASFSSTPRHKPPQFESKDSQQVS
jgi:hypothetical protein